MANIVGNVIGALATCREAVELFTLRYYITRRAANDPLKALYTRGDCSTNDIGIIILL